MRPRLRVIDEYRLSHALSPSGLCTAGRGEMLSNRRSNPSPFCPGFWGRRLIWKWVGRRWVFRWSSFLPNGRSRNCWGSLRRFCCRRSPSSLRFCFCSRGRIWFISFWCVTAHALRFSEAIPDEGWSHLHFAWRYRRERDIAPWRSARWAVSQKSQWLFRTSLTHAVSYKSL